MSHPEVRRSGIARRLLSCSIKALAANGSPHLAAWVTCGNQASEDLLGSLGFTAVTPALGRARALGLYRAAAAAADIDPAEEACIAVSVEGDDRTLWIIGESRPTAHINVNDTTVTVRFLSADSADLRRVADTAMPLKGAAWLLSHRSPT